MKEWGILGGDGCCVVRVWVGGWVLMLDGYVYGLLRRVVILARFGVVVGLVERS
jgi:hypothetical protein